MTKNEKAEKREIQKFILAELNKLDKCKSRDERIDKTQMLFRLTQYLDNYDELTPVLEEYFENKRSKEKWRNER
jgi:hypothetical protein